MKKTQGMRDNAWRFYGTALLGFTCCCWIGDTAWAQGAGGRGGTAARSSTANYPSSTSVGQATFTSDPETRKLVVVTDEETAKNISQVVSNLDRPAPQVLIKVVFLEATYTKDLDIGVEGSMVKGFGNNYTGIVNQVFPFASGLGSVGGGTYQVLGSDFQATLRAIAQAGKTEILSRPSILARNNQMATISLGQQVPLITNTRFDTFGNQINSVTYQNVGISLQVTPFITSDGLVEMLVTPQASVLADRSQWVPVSSSTNGAVSLPVINSRTADTVVIVPDGQTVVIGGLMQKSTLQSESKVPLLGDIPGLGVLFRRKVKNDAKTELLIFLTPHIVMRPSQLAAVSAAERANAALPPTFPEAELNRFLDTLPAKENAQPKPPPKFQFPNASPPQDNAQPKPPGT